MQVALLDNRSTALEKERSTLEAKEASVTKRQQRLQSDNLLLETKSAMLQESEQQMREAQTDLLRLHEVEAKYRRLMVRLVVTHCEVSTLERIDGVNRSVLADALKIWKRFLLIACSEEYYHHKCK